MRENLTFGQPLWLWAFALFPVLIALFFQGEGRRGTLLRQLVAARLQERLAGSVSVGKRRFRFLVGLLGLAALAALTPLRRGCAWLCLVCTVLLVLVWTGCGGGGGIVHTPGTPAGSYSLTITGTLTSGSAVLTHSLKVALNVQ